MNLGHSKMPKWLAYYVIKLESKLWSIKQKVFTFKHNQNWGIVLSPNEINIQNSVIQALLPFVCLIKECMIYNFTQMILVLLLFGAC